MGNWGSRFLTALRLDNDPTVKVYRGFGTATKVVVQGHVLWLRPLRQLHDQQHFWANMTNMLRLFVVQPMDGPCPCTG